MAFLDFDNDGQLDIAIANGHILDNAPKFRAGSTYAQRQLLFRNTTQRRFVEVGRSAGPGFNAQKVSRGLAVGDIDNDGDLDLLVTTNGQDAELLRNDGGNRGHALLVDLRSAPPNTRAIGARIRASTGSRTQMRDVRAGSSYLSQNDLRAHFGLGAATTVDRLEVRWPSGRVDMMSVSGGGSDRDDRGRRRSGWESSVHTVTKGRTRRSRVSLLSSGLDADLEHRSPSRLASAVPSACPGR